MKIAITGATGLVGSRLVEKLNQEGHQILVFTRNPDKAKKVFPSSAFPNLEAVKYTPQASGDWQQKISGCESGWRTSCRTLDAAAQTGNIRKPSASNAKHCRSDRASRTKASSLS